MAACFYSGKFGTFVVMNHSRRTFLKNSAMAAAAASFLPQGSFASPTRKRILGIQLYSVRDDMKNDPSGTLQKLASMGYHYVEHANYIDRKFYGYGAKEFKSLLDGMGLKMLSGHTRMDPKHWDATKKDFTDEWKWTVDDAATCARHSSPLPFIDFPKQIAVLTLRALSVLPCRGGALKRGTEEF